MNHLRHRWEKRESWYSPESYWAELMVTFTFFFLCYTPSLKVTHIENRLEGITTFCGDSNTVTDAIASWKVELHRFHFLSHPVLRGSKYIFDLTRKSINVKGLVNSAEGQQGVMVKHRCWDQTYLGSNLSLPLTSYLGKLLNFYEPQFPFKLELQYPSYWIVRINEFM